MNRIQIANAIAREILSFPGLCDHGVSQDDLQKIVLKHFQKETVELTGYLGEVNPLTGAAAKILEVRGKLEEAERTIGSRMCCRKEVIALCDAVLEIQSGLGVSRLVGEPIKASPSGYPVLSVSQLAGEMMVAWWRSGNTHGLRTEYAAAECIKAARIILEAKGD